MGAVEGGVLVAVVVPQPALEPLTNKIGEASCKRISINGRTVNGLVTYKAMKAKASRVFLSAGLWTPAGECAVVPKL
jgi:hypothetical protein